MLKLLTTSIILFLSLNALSFETKANYAYLIDYDTNTVLFEKDAFVHMSPSSMSKMMTAYIAFEELKSGNIKLDDIFNTSEKAWKMNGTRMFIPLNAQVSFEDLLKGLIIQSGNDAAVAIAENISGSEEEFVERMNNTAHKLAMNDTHFTNASGLPADNNYSCAHDLAILAIRTIKDFPEYYHFYAQKEYTFNKIKQGNRNGLLYRNMGADGLKTGHAEEAGYGLTASVKKGNRRLIAVVNGLKSNKERTNETESIVNYGFANFTNLDIMNKNQAVDKVKVIDGESKEVELITPKNILLTLHRTHIKNVKVSIKYNNPVVAPVNEGQKLGDLIILTHEGEKTFPLVASREVKKATFLQRLSSNFISLFD